MLHLFNIIFIFVIYVQKFFLLQLVLIMAGFSSLLSWKQF